MQQNDSCAATIGIIKSLIGHFDLDPKRVFDIVLECFELQPDNKILLELIPIFPMSHASQVLGFKFQYYQRMEVNSPAPFGLYKLTALLVNYAHLLPKDEDAFEHYNVFSSKRLDEVHWKWSQRMSRLLIQCLESTEYMEIRNALILLTKISGVFPVTKRSGINLEKRVTRIKSDEKEDLKVLSTSVAAALASREPSWVTDEEFGMGYVEIKPPASSKSMSTNAAAVQNSSVANISHSEPAGIRAVVTGTQHEDSVNSSREHISRVKPADGRSDRTDSISRVKSDQGFQ